MLQKRKTPRITAICLMVALLGSVPAVMAVALCKTNGTEMVSAASGADTRNLLRDASALFRGSVAAPSSDMGSITLGMRN